ncbi:MAG: adenylate/guanylate cyclase domain-containing protein, partial [Leptospiraceae bacterium]|nr:adenylate/guanylate cyclase domain-containing protein [Leptospiraceae bacterium]
MGRNIMQKAGAIIGWLQGKHISAALPEKDRRSFQLTANAALLLWIFTAVMIGVPVPPEQVEYLYLITLHGLTAFTITWLVLRMRRILTAQIILCFFFVLHCSLVAYGFRGQHVHYFYPVGMLLPLLLVSRNRPRIRFILAVIPFLALIAHQIYFKILGGESLFGPRPTQFRPDEVLPDIIGSQLILLLLAYLFIRGRDSAEA